MSWILLIVPFERKTLSEAEAGYLAGFIDGEGTLTIGRATRRENRAGVSYEAIMTVANTDLAALKAIAVMVGGGKVQLANPKKPTHYKHGYRIIWSANQIRHLLPQVLPHLKVKHRQATLLLEFLASKVSGRNVTPELWQRFEDMRAQIRVLNHRGSKPVVPVGAVTLRVREVKKPEPKPMKPCGHESCLRKHFAKGYCFLHYRKFVLRGGPKQYEKACAVCAKPFVARRSDTECCSKVCGGKKYYAQNAERIKGQVAAYRIRKMQEQT